MDVLEIKGVSKSYDGTYDAVKSCSFRLSSGRICALVGESGSGKSTLLRLIAGLERPDQGTILINGKIMSDDQRIVRPQDRNVGMVFQDYMLFPHLTVAQNIGFGLERSNKERIGELLRLVQLEGYERRYPAELSGGQAQRVALARTLAVEPDLLLLDEPFSNLDSSLKMDLRRSVAAIIRRLETSLLFITHDLTDALDIADDLVYLQAGQIIYSGPMDQFGKSTTNEGIHGRIQELRTEARQILQLTEGLEEGE